MRASLLAVLVLAGSASGQCEYAELTPTVASAGADFGWAVAIDGDSAIVAHSLAGEVLFYDRIAGVWTFVQALGSDGLTFFDEFGKALSLDGDLAIAGATQDSEFYDHQGAAYVFVRTAGVWATEAKLLASDAEAGDLFGNSVSVSGQRALVGAWRDDEGGDHAGAVYVFERSGTTWTEMTRLVPSDTNIFHAFGTVVSLSGGRALITAPWDSTLGLANGSAYIFQGAGSQWTEIAKLVPADSADGQWFGWSASLSGATAIIGAWKDSENGTGAGAAYVFEPVGPAASWIETDKWLASDANAGDGFGYSVALSGDIALVGAPTAEGGDVYLFERSGATFNESAILTSTDNQSGDQYGYSLGLAPPFAIVGALNGDGAVGNAGSAYILHLDADLANFCDSTPNSTGSRARISFTGCSSLVANDLVLFTLSAPAGEPGLFFAGPNEVQVPFGNGLRCVGGSPVLRLPPFAIASPAGVFEYAVDLQQTPASIIAAGSTWKFQTWFRDPAAGGAGFDFSDGLSIRFVP